MSAKFAVLGHGVVGSGVVELFYKNRKSIEKHAGTEMDIKYILDLRDFPESPYADKFTKNFDDILNDDEVVSVAECMGGVEPAFTFVKACLEKGKSVSTSNKELVAEKGDILLQTAKEHNCNFFFEASVGGAIPIIRPLHRCLAANDITKVAGILNGTTNFILTKMYNDNMPFAEALKLAQELGYAEKDPQLISKVTTPAARYALSLHSFSASTFILRAFTQRVSQTFSSAMLRLLTFSATLSSSLPAFQSRITARSSHLLCLCWYHMTALCQA